MLTSKILDLFCLFVVVRNVHSSEITNVDTNYNDDFKTVLKSLAKSFGGFPDQIDNYFEVKSTTYVVPTTSGQVTGLNENEAFAFYSIPYAIPPVGELRYCPPIALNAPEDQIDASVYRDIKCQQIHVPCNGSTCSEITEDCLYLNVFVPKDVDLSNPNKNDKKPVMVFLHGGAFFIGDSNVPLYNGKWLADATNTVVVTLNYRLGALGFLYFDDGTNRINGNLGLDDQRLALQWVHDNIENFGGNPDQVTLFGESAGAQSAMFHLISSKSAPFFHQVIMQSNPAIFPYPTIDEAQLVAEKVISYLRCDSTNGYNCLMEADASAIVLAGMAFQIQSGNMFDIVEPFRPVIDGDEFERQPLELFRDGKWQKYKKFIIGSNSEELDMLWEINPLPFPLMNEEDYRAINSGAYGIVYGPIISDYYINLYGNRKYGETFSKQATDSYFICPTRALARFASSDSTVYLYINTHPRQDGTCGDGLSSNVVCGYSYHASELVFVFQSGEGAYNYTLTEDDRTVESQFANYWGNFAHFSDPSHMDNIGETTASWPAYSTSENEAGIWQHIRIESPASTVENDYKEDICDFWDSLNFYIDMEDDKKTTTEVSTVVSTTVFDEECKSTTGSTAAVCYDSILIFSTLMFVAISY